MIDRKLCAPGFGYFLQWRCPACDQGVLEQEMEMIRHWPVAGVYFAIEEGHIPRSDDYGVFSATLKCSNRACRQGVAVLGDYSSFELDASYDYEHRYSVRTFHPPLKVIDVPAATPAPISEALTRSFALFWSDYAACAGVIRVAIEAVAEHLGQPPVVAGKFVALGRRLKKLKPIHPEVVEAAEAIKDVGNGGAHGNMVEQAKLLSCYELLEIELRTLFNNDATRRRTLIDDLRK
jgi:hypothetical protein